jgi:hypothetical protein
MNRLVAATAGLASLALAAGPAMADGLQYVVTFENAGDLGGVGFDNGVDTVFNCTDCAIQEATDPAFPARSGTHQVLGSDFGIEVLDPFNISWPGIGAYVTGTAQVFADFYRYDYDAQQNVLFLTLGTAGPGPNTFLGYGFDEPSFLTYVHFYSDDPFTLDDLVIGRTDVGPGIPEPSAWALMILGFGAVGAGLRRSRWRSEPA